MAGRNRELSVCPCQVRTCFLYVIKPLVFRDTSVFRGFMYHQELSEIRMFIMYICRVGACRD